MTDEKKPEDVPPGFFRWERGEPRAAAHGFRIAGGNVVVSLAYAIYDEGILLVAFTQIGAQPPQLWLRRWASHIAALEAAEDLAGRAEEYITETLGLKPRAVEDLDLDDFIQHLDMRLHNEFH